ncbi:hypothetical protein P389DRAFT_29787 [Cystobasidium minutum MCA 4210]|uniref:uncharacterized protein n=1 Tax=Cystobasidium minutum MCA 4210 TaxID=1397322 RepID=UPI0034CF6A96|eukprot:jgi/Rhomi1/29787/CE29786_170
MTASVTSNSSTAWQTARTSTGTSNVSTNSNNVASQSRSSGTAAPPATTASTYATMARSTQAGHGTPLAGHDYPRRPPSVASSSSSFTSPASHSSTSGNSRSSSSVQTGAAAAASSSAGGYGYSQRQTGSGWRGAANVSGPQPSSALSYGDALSRSSSRASSAGGPPSTYANASLPRNHSQTGLSSSESETNGGYSSRSHRRGGGAGGFSSSRSQTSIESDSAEVIAARQSSLIREVVRPVQSNTSEWEAAFNSISIDSRKKARDEEELAAGIEALGLNPDLTEKKQPLSRNTASYPPPPSSGAWSFKKSVAIPRGSTVAPENLGGPTPTYLENAAKGSEIKPESYFVGHRPKLLVLDLNQTLVTRKKATSQGARNATPRPYLSAFLEYICGSDEVSPGVFQRRFNVMIWSSAEAANVHTMCEGMCLFTNSGTQAPLLVDVWDRSSMDLTIEQYHSKYQGIKDLTKVWRILRWDPMDPASPNPALLQNNGTANGRTPAAQPRTSNPRPENEHNKQHRYPTPAPSPAPSMASSSSSASTLSTTSYKKKDLQWSQLDTILVDDTPSKASLQPFNHLCIPSWKPPTKAGTISDTGSPFHSNNDPLRPDNCLVQIVAMLDRLRCHTNVSAAIQASHFQGLGFGEKADMWAKKGFEVLKSKGIKASKDMDIHWATRVLSKTAPALPNGATPGSSNGHAVLQPINPAVHVGWD